MQRKCWNCTRKINKQRTALMATNIACQICISEMWEEDFFWFECVAPRCPGSALNRLANIWRQKMCMMVVKKTSLLANLKSRHSSFLAYCCIPGDQTNTARHWDLSGQSGAGPLQFRATLNAIVSILFSSATIQTKRQMIPVFHLPTKLLHHNEIY